MAKLSTATRNKLPTSAFAIPESRSYPIHDEGHAHIALGLASGTKQESRVRAAVHRRYPNIGAGTKNQARKSGMRG